MMFVGVEFELRVQIVDCVDGICRVAVFFGGQPIALLNTVDEVHRFGLDIAAQAERLQPNQSWPPGNDLWES